MNIKEQLALQKHFNNGTFKNAEKSGTGRKKTARSKQPAVPSASESETQDQA